MSESKNKGVSETNSKKFEKYLNETVSSNITIIATMIIIYFFISADKAYSYTYIDTFLFMGLITNPHPCDKKESKDTTEAKPANQGANKAAMKGGSGLSNQLTNAANDLQKLGNGINAFTSSVKEDIDYASYKIDTLSKYKEIIREAR